MGIEEKIGGWRKYSLSKRIFKNLEYFIFIVFVSLYFMFYSKYVLFVK